MNVCEMVWTTAGTNRVCGRCLSLKDTVVGHTNEVGVQLPPIHPRCRCTISYRELTNKPSNGNVGATTDALAAPYPTGHGYRSATHFPQAVGGCKTFDELKLYWSDNYNVKVADAIGNLHFDSVRQALAGVEAVLKEFPPAARHLREFGLLNSSIMTTERGNGKINFNPEYFTDAAKLTATLAAGVQSNFYHKNMTVFGAGAHEAGHIVEDWLLAKYGGDNVSLRIIPRQIVRKAYTRAIQTPEGKGKTILELANEISEYATRNPSECLALAVPNYLNNEVNAALLSREIWSALKEELN